MTAIMILLPLMSTNKNGHLFLLLQLKCMHLEPLLASGEKPNGGQMV